MSLYTCVEAVPLRQKCAAPLSGHLAPDDSLHREGAWAQQRGLLLRLLKAFTFLNSFSID